MLGMCLKSNSKNYLDDFFQVLHLTLGTYNPWTAGMSNPVTADTYPCKLLRISKGERERKNFSKTSLYNCRKHQWKTKKGTLFSPCWLYRKVKCLQRPCVGKVNSLSSLGHEQQWRLLTIRLLEFIEHECVLLRGQACNWAKAHLYPARTPPNKPCGGTRVLKIIEL